MLSISLCVCSLLRYHLNVFLPPFPEVACPIFLEIRNAWGKVMERSGLRFDPFLFESCLNLQRKKSLFCILVFLVQLETMLPDGLETSGQRAYR